MQIIEPKVEYWEQENPYEHVAKCASICYQSKLKEGEAAKKFYSALVSSGHISMLRHESCYFILPRQHTYHQLWNTILNYEKIKNPFINIKYYDNVFYVSTNANFMFDLKTKNIIIHDLLIEHKVTPEEFKKECPELMRYTFHITTSIDISREFNRVSPNNISEESTRYCNYSKDKFGNEINIGDSTILHQSSLSEKWTKAFQEDQGLRAEFNYDYTEDEKEISALAIYFDALEYAEKAYFDLIKRGWKPEFARKVLPLATKTEVIYTYSIKEWESILQKRLLNMTGRAHPDAVKVAELIAIELHKLGYNIHDNKLVYEEHSQG